MINHFILQYMEEEEGGGKFKYEANQIKKKNNTFKMFCITIKYVGQSLDYFLMLWIANYNSCDIETIMLNSASHINLRQTR